MTTSWEVKLKKLDELEFVEIIKKNIIKAFEQSFEEVNKNED